MIENLNVITKGNTKAIKNEEKLAEKKLEVEIWERDIYQKQRVEINHSREVDKLLEKIVEAENHIDDKKGRI